MNEHPWAKVAIAWVGVAIGGITLSQIALVLTIVFTLLQIYRQVREIRKERLREKFEASLKE